MSNLTVVWNNHGEGNLVGVFNDIEKINELKHFVRSSGQDKYLKFIDCELNILDEEQLHNYAD
jgi:hypothetical protein